MQRPRFIIAFNQRITYLKYNFAHQYHGEKITYVLRVYKSQYRKHGEDRLHFVTLGDIMQHNYLSSGRGVKSESDLPPSGLNVPLSFFCLSLRSVPFRAVLFVLVPKLLLQGIINSTMQLEPKPSRENRKEREKKQQLKEVNFSFSQPT